MRALAQPEVLKSALIAAALSALVSFPRLLLWSTRRYPLWYLGALLFLGGTVLWAFVFAWHTKYTGRPVITTRLGRRPLLLATASSLLLAVLLRVFFDPAGRKITPDDYPATPSQWLAMTLFSVGFNQLFLVFAPFAWMLRLFQSKEAAVVFTAAFGAVVLLIRNHSAQTPLPSEPMVWLLSARVTSSLLALYFYLRGGILLVWWWALLVQCRLLF